MFSLQDATPDVFIDFALVGFMVAAISFICQVGTENSNLVFQISDIVGANGVVSKCLMQ